MFNSNAQFEIHVISGGDKKCVLRYPTDEEWCFIARQRRVLRQSIGRNKSQSRVLGVEAPAAELFAKIRIDKDGTSFDEAEGVEAIRKLERCRVLGCDRDGDSFRVTMAVPGGQVVHLLKIPMQSDKMAFGRAAAPAIVEGLRSQEIRTILEPTVEFWAKIGRVESGYAEGSSIPINHKDAAVTEVLVQTDALNEDDDPEA